MKKKNIMLIAHFCDYGEENSNNRFNYLAELFFEKGYGVKVVTSSFSHREKKQRELDSSGTYETILIHEPSYSKNISLKRLFYSHKAFARNLKKYLEKSEKPDVIYCAVPSVDAALVAAKYAEKNEVPFIIDVQDLWPEAFKLVFNVPVISDLIFYPMMKKANSVYSKADRIIAVSETYAEKALAVNFKCKNASSVFLGTDINDFDEAATQIPLNKKEDGETWIAYCGTLGHSYNLDIVLDALNNLQNKGVNNFRFIVMGSGPLEEQFRKKADEYNLPTIFTGKLPYDEMCSQLKCCDIAVNPISKGAAQSIINKHSDYAAAGIPVINTQECKEYRNLIDTYNCGINCDADSVESVENALRILIEDKEQRDFMGKNSRKMAEEKFDRKTSYNEIVKVASEF